MLKSNRSLLYLVPQPVETKIQVLHAPMMLRILRYLQCGLIVDVEHRRRVEFVAERMQQIAKEENFLCGSRSINIFGFSGRESDNRLEATLPTNRSSTHLDKIARGRATSIRVPSMIRVGIGQE